MVDNLLYYGLIYLIGIACGIILPRLWRGNLLQKKNPALRPTVDEELSVRLARGASPYANNDGDSRTY